MFTVFFLLLGRVLVKNECYKNGHIWLHPIMKEKASTIPYEKRNREIQMKAKFFVYAPNVLKKGS